MGFHLLLFLKPPRQVSCLPFGQNLVMETLVGIFLVMNLNPKIGPNLFLCGGAWSPQMFRPATDRNVGVKVVVDLWGKPGPSKVPQGPRLYRKWTAHQRKQGLRKIDCWWIFLIPASQWLFDRWLNFFLFWHFGMSKIDFRKDVFLFILREDVFSCKTYDQSD